jgi:hypothetical protein
MMSAFEAVSFKDSHAVNLGGVRWVHSLPKLVLPPFNATESNYQPRVIRLHGFVWPFAPKVVDAIEQKLS